MQISLSKNCLELKATKREINSLKEKFKRHHCIVLNNFINNDLLEYLQKEIEASSFKKKSYKNIGTEFKLANNKIEGLLHFLINDNKFFNFIEKITGCKKIGNFIGRVYKFNNELGDFEGWHDDNIDNRLITLSINLSKAPYSGGILQIRDSKTKKTIYKIANVGKGSAVIFRISKDLEHMVTPVMGKNCKTSFAGWFREGVNLNLYKPWRKKAGNKLKKLFKRNSPLIKNPEFHLYKKENNKLTLINFHNGLYYTLNPTGYRIWQLISKKDKVKDIIINMKKEYKVDLKSLQKDVLNQINEFYKMGLIECV